MDALKPCPFCGGIAYLCTVGRLYPWVAKCSDCGAQAGGTAYQNDEWNAECWNKRPALTAAQERIAELEAQVATLKADRPHIVGWVEGFEFACEAHDPLRDAAIQLANAETDYRSKHDLHGGGDLRTGRAWDHMRRCSQSVRDAALEIERAALRKDTP